MFEKYKPKEFIGSKDEIIEVFNSFKKPCVLKITNELHKTEFGGVVLNINTKDDLLKALEKLEKLDSQFLLQEQVKGIELFIGSMIDPTFGKVLAFGIGGIFTEVYQDITIRKIPINEKDIESMLEDIKGKKMIFGYRNIKTNIQKLKEFLLNLSKYLEKIEYKELDINPLIINENGVYCVDVKVIT